ncbi:MAG: PilZ domain-containing protein [Deltaproteobacteria bacterium]|nr:PilZ domain-containing protein [Deltaproteobacteria bacterium]MBW2359375.1 PilZ domain-containing protein [Deltaproteobacteria bacterium]
MNEFLHDDERLLRDVDANAEECAGRWPELVWRSESAEYELELNEEISELEGSLRPWALVLDGGDLLDIERMLDDFGTSSVRLTTGVPSGDEVPRRLLVASGSRVLHFDHRAVDKDDRVVKLALLSKPSQTLVRQVRSMGYDYVVERPVHPDALRHLLRAALYRGDERRCEPRFSTGYPIHYRVGWRRCEAMLAELSRWGCSLWIAGAPKLGSHIKVCLPAELTGKSSLTLSAEIVRSEGCGRVTQVSVHFGRDSRTRARVGGLLPQLRCGPMTLPS